MLCPRRCRSTGECVLLRFCRQAALMIPSGADDVLLTGHALRTRTLTRKPLLQTRCRGRCTQQIFLRPLRLARAESSCGSARSKPQVSLATLASSIATVTVRVASGDQSTGAYYTPSKWLRAIASHRLPLITPLKMCCLCCRGDCPGATGSDCSGHNGTNGPMQLVCRAANSV